MKTIFSLVLLSALIFSCNSVFSQKFEPVKEIPEGKALVYIYRPHRLAGMIYHYTVNANEEKVSEAHLKDKSYLVYFAKPGRYTFWGEYMGARLAADLDVEVGETYYIYGDAYKIKIQTVETAKKEIKKCKLSKPKSRK